MVAGGSPGDGDDGGVLHRGRASPAAAQSEEELASMAAAVTEWSTVTARRVRQ